DRLGLGQPAGLANTGAPSGGCYRRTAGASRRSGAGGALHGARPPAASRIPGTAGIGRRLGALPAAPPTRSSACCLYAGLVAPLSRCVAPLRTAGGWRGERSGHAHGGPPL